MEHTEDLPQTAGADKDEMAGLHRIFDRFPHLEAIPRAGLVRPRKNETTVFDMNNPHTLPFQLPTEATSESVAVVLAYLVQHGLATRDDTLVLERAGASNMNCVWRARLAHRSVIIKQARPWVEKYPTIAAPVERAEAEARFYQLAGLNPNLGARMPRLIHHDAQAHLLVLSDLAPVTPMESAYGGARLLTAEVIDDLVRWVAHLHQAEIPAASALAFRNHGMRRLNHAHIFDLPLRAEGVFDGLLEEVTPGLAGLARQLRADRAYVAKVGALGRRYLETDRPRLIHGDLFFGSLLLNAKGKIVVIDPEFSFGGDPEYDLGVFYAHLLLSGQAPELCGEWLRRTILPGTPAETLLNQYAGVEIMRRLIGVAQLPLCLPLEDKRELLARSHELVCARNSG